MTQEPMFRLISREDIATALIEKRIHELEHEAEAFVANANGEVAQARQAIATQRETLAANEAQLDGYLRQAEQQVAAYRGAIGEMQKLIAPVPAPAPSSTDDEPVIEETPPPPPPLPGPGQPQPFTDPPVIVPVPVQGPGPSRTAPRAKARRIGDDVRETSAA